MLEHYLQIYLLVILMLSCSLFPYQSGMAAVIVLWVFVLAIFVILGNGFDKFWFVQSIFLNGGWSFFSVFIVMLVKYLKILILFLRTVKFLFWSLSLYLFPSAFLCMIRLLGGWRLTWGRSLSPRKFQKLII